MSHKPLWALSFDDICLPTRAYTCLSYGLGLTKAWHLAVLCDKCLLRTYNLGKRTLADIRRILEIEGFPCPPERCKGSHVRMEGPNSVTWMGQCAYDLKICMALLEKKIHESH